MKKQNKALTSKINRLQKKLEESIEVNGVLLDDETSKDLENIVKEEDSTLADKFPEDSFPHVFWNQQKAHILKEGNQKKGIRWHPLIIKLCLYLRHQSSKAYETLRKSGCLALPSQRTLRDYSNAVKAVVGFSKNVDIQLMQAARLSSSPDYHKLVMILIDEMHIKEELVYDKHSGRLVGFIDLGMVNNHLSRFEESLCGDDDEMGIDAPTQLANSMVVFMIKGIFTSLQFPYAHFPCSSLAGEQLFDPFWESVLRMERMGFKVRYTV